MVFVRGRRDRDGDGSPGYGKEVNSPQHFFWSGTSGDLVSPVLPLPAALQLPISVNGFSYMSATNGVRQE